MSRSTHHHRQMQTHQQQQEQIMADNDAAALATEIFDHFCAAITMRQILGLYRNMCDTIGLRAGPLNEFYPKLKSKVRSWKAQALWKKFDARASHRAYSKGNACTGTRVLVIGAGPCGLRTAIEAQLLGAKVVVVEKRDRISRNNVLHLWPFVITDLRNLGAKKFYGKFCAGSIDHISIRQLQCILLKVALLLGVEIHEGVSFENTVEPSDGCGWRAQVSPEDHAVSHYEFDVLIGADGKRNTLEGFRRKEFRGKLAIAITANFINKKTEAEAKVEEISGVAFIFNQSFFKELYQTTGIDLENIVYYKDETHYFVMTAKKHSLIDKGVIIQDFADPAELLAPANVNTEKLLDYAKEAAEFSTKYQMPNLEFAVNHYGKPDVAMFDFTSMFAAEASCRVITRKNYRLLQCLVGDSLLEPFWPTGSGCARGFLSSMDAANAIKLWSNPRNSILGVIAQRESIYRLLAQTTPENLQRDIGAYTVDPVTRYPNLNKTTVNVWQVKHLLDTDDQTLLEQTFMDTNIVQTLAPETPIRRKRRTGDTLPLSTVLLRWIKAQLHSHEFAQDLNELSECFSGGKVLCTLINRYRPDLIDLNTIKDYSVKERNELAFKILETELSIPRVMTASDSLNLENIDSKIWLNYLEQICEVFRGEIPHVKHPKLDFFELKERTAKNKAPDFSHLFKANAKKSRSPMQDVDMAQTVHRRSILDEEKIRKQRKYGPDFTPVQTDTSRRAKKRRSQEKTGNVGDRQKRLAEIEENRLDRQSKRRLQRYQQTQNFYKSLHMLQANTLLRESDSSSPFEDYSLYIYRQQAPGFNDRVKELERKLLYPDRERGIQSALPRGGASDEQFSDRIKSMEQKITSRNAGGTDKKPKDLLRAIGKIENTDWNVREIEKKIEQSKRTEIGKSKEKVPKWTKEQFLARQNKMSKPERQAVVDEKFKNIDQTLKNFDKQLKEGSVLEVGERGKNKVASIAGQFVKKDDNSDEKGVPVQRSSSKVGLIFNKQGASEKCHFCKQTVYLMEKISVEGLVLHRSCLKCYHCHTNLRLGAYAFDRDDPVGRFYCTQHFRLPAKVVRPAVRKSMKNQNKSAAVPGKADNTDEQGFKTPDRLRGRPENLAQLDLLDRGQTPERIEFENVDPLSDGEPSQEHIIDENEWTDRNFITESEDTESNISDSDSSDDDSESEYEEVNGSPLGVQTLQLATDWIGKQRHSYMDDDSDGDFYDSSEGLLDDDDADSQTEGEEFKKARELRRQEVKVQPPPNYLPTDTETEVLLKEVVDQQCTNSNDNNKENKNSDNNDILIDDNKTNTYINVDTKVDTNDKIDANANMTAICDTSSDRNVNIDSDKSKDNANSERLNICIKPKEHNEQLVDAKLRTGSSESVNSSGSLGPLKNEIKRIENSSSNRISSGIDALNENLYNLNSFIKLQKDVDNLKRDCVVKDDIMKKLSLKERWLNQDTSGTILNSVNQALRASKTELEKEGESSKDVVADNEKKMEHTKPDEVKDKPEEVKPTGFNQVKDNNEKSDLADRSKTTDSYEKTELSSTDELATNATSSKPEESSNEKDDYVDSEDLEIEKLVLSAMDEINDDLQKKKITETEGRNLGKLFYKAENSEQKMGKALKNIEVKNFSDTMNSIQSQITTPKISKQSSCDLAKYFPNQKQDKSAPAAANKNQKSLKEVNLSKYFSQSPTSSRKEIKSKPATMVTPSSPNSQKRPVPLELFGVTQNGNSASHSTPASRKNSLTSQSTKNSKGKTTKADSIDQLDGAIDLKPSRPARKNTLNVPGSTVKRRTKPKSAASKSFQIVKDHDLKSDPDEEIFEEILGANCSRPSSAEYRRMFDDEKSPSEDISDKIEKILEEEERARQQGAQVNPRKKKMLKAKSLSEESKRSKIESSDESLNKRDSNPNCNEILTDLEKTMAFLKEGWKTEATRFLESKRDSFYSKRKNGHAGEEAQAMAKPLTSWAFTQPSQSSSSKKCEETKKEKVGGKTKLPVKKSALVKPQSPVLPVKKRSEKTKSGKEKTIKVSPKTKKNDKVTQKLELEVTRRSISDDLSDLSVGVSDAELDKIVNELTKELEEYKKAEARLERKESLPDVVKSGNMSDSILREIDNLEAGGPLDDTREELDLLEKGELAKIIVSSDDRKSLTDSQIDTNANEQGRFEEVVNVHDEFHKESRRSSAKSQENDSVTDSPKNAIHDQVKCLSQDSAVQHKSSSGSLSLNFSFSATPESSRERLSNAADNQSDPLQNDSATINSERASSGNSKKTASHERTVTSEEDSIDAIFNQLTDDMLVGVEFDSSDELVRIIPHGKCNSSEGINEDKESLNLNLDSDSVGAGSIKYFEICKEKSSPSVTGRFPIKPTRRNKSISSSGTPDIPLVPTRTRKTTLTKLNSPDIAPSVQDVLEKVEKLSEKPPVPIDKNRKQSGVFPLKNVEDEVHVAGSESSSPGKKLAEKKNNVDTVTPKIQNSERNVKNKNLLNNSKEKNGKVLNSTVFESAQDEEAYIEELEKERRAALRKRDEMYARENDALTLPIPISNPDESVSPDIQGLSQSPLKSSYSSIPPSIASSNDSLQFASAVDISMPQRPQRQKSVPRSTEEPVDPSTHYLLERSKMLHSMKENFINEKMVGKNPYLKAVIDEEKQSQEHLDYRDPSVDSVELRIPATNRSYRKFPTLRSVQSNRREHDRHGSSESIDRGRKTYSLASSLGPRNFVEYFKRSPSKPKDHPRDLSKERRENSKDSCIVQSDSESSSPDDVGLNSATEISTDSEFDHDPIYREAPPRIFIDDTHIRKPTRVQVRQGVIANSPSQKLSQINNQQKPTFKPPEIEFKPLVQVDPSLLNSNRTPLKNPRVGDYLLSKAPSTEGIASRKSLELKKRYLLGEQGIGNGIMKSGSTSILDSKLKNFHSNISECQKLLNPSSDISPSMKTFLEKTQIGTKDEDTINILDSDKKSSDEKENVFVNNQNALNKEKEFTESVNTTLVDMKEKKMGAGKICSPIIETIDLISPEKSVPIIDLTESPSPRTKTDNENSEASVVDLTADKTPEKEKAESTSPVISEKPDVSKDAKDKIPDIITYVEETKVIAEVTEQNNDINDTCIEVPTIPWSNKKQEKSDLESDSLSNSSSSSLDDIPHFILDSTTSPETQNGVEQIVPRVEVHDSTGNLMQIDSLMIIDGKYVGDPEDLEHMEIPKGISLPEVKKLEDLPTDTKSDERSQPELGEKNSPKPLITDNIKQTPTLMGDTTRPVLKFDTRNENKVDTLRNIPLVLESTDNNQRPQKPNCLILAKSKSESYVDKDKTPTANEPTISDSETEMTGQVLTETELSDWTADDAVSENFVDIEFALNSNRGTIKRNKKHKKKLSPPKTTPPERIMENRMTPIARKIASKEVDSKTQKSDCSILKNLNIDEIEFMDTGSEGSCAETYSATNRALLQNRGYIQFIENHHGNVPTSSSSDRNYGAETGAYLQLSEKPKEIEGIHYIEQGACILNNEIDLKTPVNEVAPIFAMKSSSDQIVPAQQPDNVNDIDDDSLMYMSQGTGTGTTTTEESDVLTVVVSPLDISRRLGEEASRTSSSSDKNDRSVSNSSAASKIPIRRSSDENRRQSTDDLASGSSASKKRDSDDISYEEYVRRLQMKITQISNARDSLDIRKQRRKSSKGSGAELNESVAATTQSNSVIENSKNLSVFASSIPVENASKPPEQVLSAQEGNYANAAGRQLAISSDSKPQVPTVTKKLEEITKERTKQKDLIHDLVMDKLQCKKQLNLEKRLNRSRNRTMMLGATPSPPPKVATDYQCSNLPHYHIASAERRNSKSSPSIVDEKDTRPVLSASPSKHIPQDELPRYKDRPLSDNMERPMYTPKITKTQSFCVYSTRCVPLKDDTPKSAQDPFKSANTFVTPHPPPRAFRKIEDTPAATPVSATTEKLRAEARAQARLKSNEDLGLSPEEKLKLLRKRYHLDLQQALDGTSTNQSDDMKVRERKMVTSKSFNDITAVQGLISSDENFSAAAKSPRQLTDCTSDPNLVNSSEKVAKLPTPATRRRKDPERRKSLIQAVSNFFHKRKEKDTSPSTPNSPKDKSEGVFSRFKISPKVTKEKSKDRDELSSCERIKSHDFLKNDRSTKHSSSSPQLHKQSSDDLIPPPIPPLPLNYQRSDESKRKKEDVQQVSEEFLLKEKKLSLCRRSFSKDTCSDESYTTECREQKKQRAISKASRQAELKRLRIAQEIQREQEEIEVKLKELEARGVLIEKALRGEGQDMENLETSSMGASDEKLLKELLEIWRNITQLKKRDEELGIRQKELQLEHRHAQLKEELNNRLSCSKLDKSSADIAAEGAILNEMLEIVAKRAALRPSETTTAILRQSSQNNDNHSDI